MSPQPSSSPLRLPDPLAAARETADWINADRDAAVWQGIKRMRIDTPRLDQAPILAGATAYHREAMSRLPDFTKYPEAKPWVEYALAYERELRRLANLTDDETALLQSLNPYMTFRGYKETGARLAVAPAPEKCRVAFFPETDEGPLHIKNVDDPLTWWKPEPALPRRAPLRDFRWSQVTFLTDGVGSGLHIDTEPAELFPLPVLTMMPHYASDTPGVVEFLRRYAAFWSGANILVFDKQGRTVAIEKCSRGFCEVFGPNEHGQTHISGMTCRDPRSPQGGHQQAKRDEYRRLFGIADDGPDAVFWGACRQFEAKLSGALRGLGRCPKAADVIRLFITTYPEGLNKAGLKLHPNQGLVGYTLITRADFLGKHRAYRWQRSQDGQSWPAEPEVCQYE